MSLYRTCKLSLASALFGAIWCASIGAPSSFAQTAAANTGGIIKGQVVDTTGSAIPAADVTVNAGKNVAKKVQTDEQGAFNVTGLAPGNYTVVISRFGFANFSTKSIAVAVGKPQTLQVTLELQANKQEVTVASDAVGSVSVDPSNNASQLVLKGADLDALPDDPDDLAADLQALAGPSAGPNGGQIYIDGFTGGNLPPKSSIREIRINQNPFSAEYDQLGFGRIEILTKPGTDKLRGSVFFNDSDGIVNSRNPYLTSGRTPAFISKYFGGNLSGALSKKASFFIDFNRREIDDNAIINATILSPSFVPTPYSTFITTPNRNNEASARLDYAINASNTLVARYSFQEARQNDAGIGTFSLPTTGYTTVSPESRVQLTETDIIGAKIVNETRFQFLNDRSTQDGPNNVPSLAVSSAFNGGGAQVGRSWDTQRHYEIQNYTSIAQGTHAIKFGVRVRIVSDDSNSESNFGGGFTFAGISSAALLGANNVPVAPGLNCGLASSVGNPDCVSITSIESYRRALVLPTLGYTPAQVCLYGGCPYQFSITTGQPFLHVNEADAGFFLMDDWRYRPNLTISVGLRYEMQNHLSDYGDIAPRLGFAWSPGAGKSGRSKTVIRGGAGMFYQRFAEGSILNAERFNGANQVRYVLTDPTFYNAGNPAIPSIPQLQQLVAAQTSTSTTSNTVTKYIVDPNLQAPTIIQSSIAVERQLPKNTTLSVNFLDTHDYHYFRTVNINSPLDGTYNPAIAGSGVYPYGAAAGGIYEYQSTAVLNQNQLITSVNSRVNSNISLTAYYIFAHSNSNSDGIGTFPSDSYNLKQDYGPSSLDVRNRFTLIGTFLLKYGVRLSPTVFAQTGTPFNITVGQDLNGDLQLNDRPSLVAASACGTSQYIKCTKFGDFNLDPAAGSTIISRNYGRSPGSFTVNMRISKTWGFGEVVTRPARGNGGGGGGAAGPPPGMGGGGPGGGGGRGGGGFGGGGRGGGGGGGDTTNKRYNLNLSLEGRNILNHVNPGAPIGNLLSPEFGESNSLGNAGGPGGSNTNNRRLTLGLRFSF
jgi:hypothetical protein